ncbi:MAG TPA: hypothetical protein VG324_02350 [Blastocatellia bacterium]|nr:hypothetical protein [Blastocatellia bacterium]
MKKIAAVFEVKKEIPIKMRHRICYSEGRPMRLLAFGFLGLALACGGALAAPQVDQKVQSQTQSAAPAPSFHEEVLREFSPESKPQEWMASEHHVAWVEKQGGSRIVKLDGKQQGGVYQEVKYFGDSSDVAHLAFFGKRGSKWVMVLDGQEHPQEYTKTISLAFVARDGMRILYVTYALTL